MVNGTELYLLHTWCCTKLHINHPLPFLFNTLCFVACPSDQIMLHVVKPSSLTHICFSIQIIPYGYLPNYLYCNINIKKSWGLIFKREERDLAAATFDTNWRDKLQDSHQETFKKATEWWRQHKQGKVTNPTGWEDEWNGKKLAKGNFNRGEDRWHYSGKTFLDSFIKRSKRLLLSFKDEWWLQVAF